MTKRASVERLRYISKRRSIRRPLPIQDKMPGLEQDRDQSNVEWPIGK